MWPHRRQPTSLPRPQDSPGKNTGVGCHFLLQCMKVKVKSISCVQFLATPWTAVHQAPPSMGFSRQEYGSGVPLPSPTLSGQSLPKTKSGGWSYCSPSVLETTLPRHLEGGRNTVKLLSWMYAPQLSPETLCCFNAFVCVCVCENPFSSPADGRHSSPLFMTESQLKIQSSFWKAQWWFLLLSSSCTWASAL